MNNSSIPESFKKHYLPDGQYSEQSPHYLYYLLIFREAFIDNHSEKEIDETTTKLCLAGYFYYKYLIGVDPMLDHKSEKIDNEKFINSIIFQEESIKLFMSVFPLDSRFWQLWNKRKSEYLFALKEGGKTDSDISFETFKDIADCKSAFGKIGIDVWMILFNGDENLAQSLLESHRLFSIGVQILDDLIDFKEDIKNPQVNIVHIKLRALLGIDKEQFKESEANKLLKNLYSSGLAKELLALAFDYLERARCEVKDLPFKFKLWNAYIRKVKRSVIYFQRQSETYLDTIAQGKDEDIPVLETEEIDKVINAVSQSVKNYIRLMQSNDGSWEEWFIQSGMSNVWTTGFVVSHLNDINVQIIDNKSINDSCNFLKNNQLNGLWGFNNKTIEDTDSSTFALLSLFLNGNDIKESFRLWLSRQNDDGGFGTYVSDEVVRKEFKIYTFQHTNGFTQSHICVTALAFYFLALSRLSDESLAKTKTYILKNKSEDGLWKTYWWTSPIYSTYYVLKAFHLLEEEPELILNALRTILKKQANDGSFGDSHLTMKSALYTGMVLELLCLTPEMFFVFETNAQAAASWLVQNCNQDGSVNYTAFLLMPKPDVTDTATVEKWQRKNKVNDHVIGEDTMRIFSCTMVVKALTLYEKAKELTWVSQQTNAASVK